MRNQRCSQIKNDTRLQNWKSDDPNDDCWMPESSFSAQDQPDDGIFEGYTEQISLDLISLSNVCKPMLKAYFAESMTGISEDLFVSEQAIRVRDAFISLAASRFTVYAPANNTPCGGSFSNEHIYGTNFRRINESDLIVFHQNGPSSGMGMEAEIAAGVMVPAIILRPKGTRPSKMFPGFDLRVIKTIEYSSIDDLRRQLSESLEEIAKTAQKWTPVRRKNWQHLKDANVGHELLSARMLKGVSRVDMVEHTGMPEEFLRRIECFEAGVETLTTSQLSQLCNAYGVTIALTGDAPLSVYRNEIHELPQTLQISLGNLAQFIRQREKYFEGISSTRRIHDWKTLTLWRAYRETYDFGLVGREALEDLRTASDWESLYDSTLL